ncbi:MAG: DUF2974 domain-containing protein [Clostridia bacterium]|nr:DUF2974 domain-containing protein [Clostridia bacterium]
MPNMMDYLAWRGDIALDYSPFNDVDSLILASLSYLTYPEETGLLRDLALTVPPVDKMQFSFVHEIRAMLSAAAMTERFAGIGMRHPVAVTDQDRDMQFAAVTFDLPDGTHYVAFRGTDSTIVGWREDFNMAFESPVPAQSAAVRYLHEAAALTDGPLILGGHSKGGNLAVYAAAHADPMTQNRIRAVYSFDGPGLDDATMASEGYARIARRIRSFVPQHSVVGLLLTYHPEYTVVKSDGVGLLQHDSFTWQVLGTDFIAVTELDVSAQLVDQTVHTWLSQVSPEKRRIFVNTIFDVLEASGANTVKELVRNIPSRLPAVLKALQQVDAETARMVLTLWGQFVAISATNIIELVRQRLTPDNTEHIQGDATHGTES